MAAATKSLVFCFDIQCPWAYLASTEVEKVAADTGARLEWRPVLLGGLYLETKAPHGSGSATDAMPPTKKVNSIADLQLQANRRGVDWKLHPRHPLHSVEAMRLLCLAPPDVLPKLAHELYRQYWVVNADVDNMKLLTEIAGRYGIKYDKDASTVASSLLRANTTRAAADGAFGVPALFVTNPSKGIVNQLYWGVDRMTLVRRALGQTTAMLPRFSSSLAPVSPKKTVYFYFDFASPWSFLGWTQIKQYAAIPHCIRPIPHTVCLHGVGTPNMPMLAMSDAKRTYMRADMMYWCKFWNEPINWPDQFPIRTPTPLRIASAHPEVIPLLYRAAWQQNINIGDDAALVALLNRSGHPGDAWLKESQQPAAKEALAVNNKRAIGAGVFGVPSYQIDDHVYWGQDRLDLVLDVCCGWSLTGAAAATPIRSRM